MGQEVVYCGGEHPLRIPGKNPTTTKVFHWPGELCRGLHPSSEAAVLTLQERPTYPQLTDEETEAQDGKQMGMWACYV